MIRDLVVFSLSLCVLLTNSDAAKVTMEKEPIVSETGEFLGYQDFDPLLLSDLGVVAIADYPTYLAGEVPEAGLERFRQQALDLGIMSAVRRDFDLIQVNGNSFSSFGEPAGLPQDLVIARYDGPVGLYLVQLKAPLTPQWHAALAGAAEIVSYLPENTFLVRAPATTLPVLASLDGVQHVSLFQPAYKLQRSLLQGDEPVAVIVELDAGQDVMAAAAFMRSLTSQPVDMEGDSLFAHAAVRVSPAQVRAIARRPEVLWVEPALEVEPSGEREATVVAGEDDGLRPIRYPGGHNAWLRSKGFCTPTEAVPYPGCMVYWTKVGVIDSGLDLTICRSYDEQTGVCALWDPGNRRHPDLNHHSNLAIACPPAGEGIEGNQDCTGPVVRDKFYCSKALDMNGNPINLCFIPSSGYYDFSDGSPQDPGHGTSVSSLIAGDPLSIDPGDPNDPQQDTALFYRGMGIAPSAQLVVAKFTRLAIGPQSTYGMRDQDYSDLIGQVYLTGARFATNSWNLKSSYGQVSQYEYTLFSKAADRLVRDAVGDFDDYRKEMTLVFSAGNWDPQHPTDPTWVASPANAKNVVSVGAARGWSRVNDQDGGRGHQECPAEDHFIRDIAGGTYPGEWHSRRGYPDESGGGGALPRYKPDLVAPGTQVAAARSTSSWAPGDPQADPYRCFGATSSAAPAVTASAVLAEAWYYYTKGNAFPSPAMNKAMLVAHADNLHEDGGTDLLPPTASLPDSPSLAQGWGRVDLDALFQQDVPVVVLDQDHGGNGRRFTGSGQYWVAQLQVADPSRYIIAVLVYTDRFSEPPAASLTVNDLDLKLFRLGTGPGTAHTYWGNYFAPGSWYSQDTGGQILPSPPEDSHNTVEVIRVPAGVLTTTFRVRVRAKTVQANAVPGLDGNGPNQDFALYVYNAVQ